MDYAYFPFTYNHGDDPTNGLYGGVPVSDPGTIWVVHSRTDDEDENLEDKVIYSTSLLELAVDLLRDEKATALKSSNYEQIADAFLQAANLLYVALGKEVRK